MAHIQMATLRRDKLIQEEELIKQSKQESKMRYMMEESIRREESVKDKIHYRQLQIERQEREMIESMQRERENKEIKAKQVAQEEKLAIELEKLKHDKLHDEKMRQKIRADSVELQELEAKLRAAYMNKERAAQLAEKQAMRFDTLERDAEIAGQMKAENERAEAEALKKETEVYREQIRYQQELERQLEDKEHDKQKAYQEFLKEKLMIDEIVRKIYEEDKRDAELKWKKRKATQKYIADFLAAHERWKAAEKARMEDENEEIRKYAAQQEVREAENVAEKRGREEALAKVQAMLGHEKAKHDEEVAEMERIRMELQLEEEEERMRRREMREIEEKMRQRLELRKDELRQRQMKERKVEMEQQEELEFRRQMMEKFAEDDKVEQMNAQRRRMKQQEHKRAVEELMERRRSQYALDQNRLKDELEQEQMLEKYRQQVIEEERQRMLREHATKLLGYLPKGVIRDEHDVNMLGPKFQEEYSRRNVDVYDTDDWEK